MKSRIIFILALGASFAAGGAFAQEGHAGHSMQAAQEQQKPEPKKQLWTCGMHPQVVLDHPGDCPICHMKLTPLKQDGEASGSGTVKVSPEAVQAMGLKTSTVAKGQVSRELRTVGEVAFDESSLADVATRYKGWVEKLHVDFTGKEVHKGETLLELYSPDLYSAQAEYLIAKKAKDSKLLDNAKLKLKLLDFPDSSLAELDKAEAPLKSIPLEAPRDGVVVEKAAVQGQMFEPGLKLYRIADLGTVWVIAQVYERDLPFVSLGQKADIEASYFPGRRYHGAVSYIYPTVDEATRTAKVRIELHNPGYTLKPGNFVNVELKQGAAKEGLLIPDSAVLRGGGSDIVFVSLGDGRYEPRDVKLGPRAGKDLRQVLEGLKEGDAIVSSGQFLLDSEANLRAAVRRLAPVQQEKAIDVSTAKEASPDEVEYVCPMPEHMSITYKAPGKCPLCGMALVPYEAKSQDVKQLDHYECPMHPEVKQAQPGKCPKCAMTLIPVYKEASGHMSMDERTLVKEVSNIDHYECPMKEDSYSSPKPGKCPKCGMDLVPVLKK